MGLWQVSLNLQPLPKLKYGFLLSQTALVRWVGELENALVDWGPARLFGGVGAFFYYIRPAAVSAPGNYPVNGYRLRGEERYGTRRTPARVRQETSLLRT